MKLTLDTQIDELTDEELAAWTEENVLRYIEIEAAREGLPLVPGPVGEKPTKPDVAHDVVGFTCGSFAFTSRQDAQAVADLIATLPGLHTSQVGHYWQSEWRYGFAGDPHTPDVAAVRYKTEDVAAATGESIRLYEATLATWRDAKNLRDDLLEQRSQVTQHVRERVSLACSNLRRLARAKADYDTYLDLADGKTTVARKFFRKADSYGFSLVFGDVEIDEAEPDGEGPPAEPANDEPAF